MKHISILRIETFPITKIFNNTPMTLFTFVRCLCRVTLKCCSARNNICFCIKIYLDIKCNANIIITLFQYNVSYFDIRCNTRKCQNHFYSCKNLFRHSMNKEISKQHRRDELNSEETNFELRESSFSEASAKFEVN